MIQRNAIFAFLLCFLYRIVIIFQNGGVTIVAIKNMWNNLDWSYLTNLMIQIIPALLAVSFHEFSHALAAYLLGDNTAKAAGRLSLNPIKHIDPLGLIMLVIFGFGWAKPVPIRGDKFKDPKQGTAITALAGPLSNFIMAFVVLLMLLVLEITLPNPERYYFLLRIMSSTVYLSTAFGIFNLFPFPPLDGSKILFSVLPYKVYYKILKFEKYGIFVLLIVIFILNKLGVNIIGNLTTKVYKFFVFVLYKFFIFINLI